MADDVVIRAEGLGKKYLIGHSTPRERYVALRDVIAVGARNLARTAVDLARGRPMVVGDEVEEFWALKDINFEVRRGQVLGVIGRNGAGKSTLLKILSRITEPSEGRVTIKGRVASLLEVGTGFHPELTGRENVYLNGAILGMSQTEIRRKFDEIVAFSEVGKFLDTPVKRYSSGMYVRLAFAVAAHLEPEILVVDEVLAVGDAEFQKKCLGKINEIATGGRTVLFVSHNMSAVTSLCTSGILLLKGRIQHAAPIREVLTAYMAEGTVTGRTEFRSDPSRPSIDWAEVDPSALHDRNLVVRIGFSSPAPLSPLVGIAISSTAGFPVWGSNSRFHPAPGVEEPRRSGVLKCVAMNIPLAAGDYVLSIWLGDRGQNYDRKQEAIRLTVLRDGAEGNRPPPEITGCLDWRGEWTSVPLESENESHDATTARNAAAVARS